jgi:hypothetical protein
MEKIILPKDGSIVVIDDSFEEAFPLIKLFAKKGNSVCYYTGKADELPSSPVKKVRMLFADIQLGPALTGAIHPQIIVDIIRGIIPENNGPYIVAIWSRKEDIYGTQVKEMLLAEGANKKPIAVVMLNKKDFFKIEENDTSNLDEISEHIDETLAARFSKEDIRLIKEKIKEKYFIKSKLTPKKHALQSILKKIAHEMKDFKAFLLFLKWENLVHDSSSATVFDFASLYDLNKFWEQNFKNIIFKMAHAQIGQNVNTIDDDEIVRNALKTINSSFLDRLNQLTTNDKYSSILKIDKDNIGVSFELNGKVFKIKWGNDFKYSITIDGEQKGAKIKDLSKLVNNVDGGDKAGVGKELTDYSKKSHEINTRLIFDFSKQNIFQPGLTYDVDIATKRKRELLGTYIKGNFKERLGRKYKFSEEYINKFKFIETEVTPNCDFAQNKWLKARLLPGVMYRTDEKLELQDSDSFYRNLPIFTFNGKNYRIIYDFRLLKAVGKSSVNIKHLKVLFRIKNEPMSDLISHLSSHASRIGLITVD